MSNYFMALEPVAKERYLKKLRLLSMSEKDDPYASSNEMKFVDNMALWPAVEFGHIFCYFIERPGTYTKRELMQWKSLDAYMFFKSGYVRTIRVWASSSSCCVLRALVNPSQKAPEKASRAWIGLRPDGEIVAAHCTCMAGLGEGCSHVAAVLFKIEYAARNGYTAATSNECQWNHIFTTKHEPSRIASIDFRHSGEDRCSRKLVAPSTPAPTTEEKSAFLAGLQHVFPKAAVLSSFFPQQRSSMSTPARELPATIASLFNPRYKDLDHGDLLKECEQVFKSLSVSPAEAEYLTQSTLLQSSSAVWYTQRKGRITASYFGAVCHTSLTQPSRSLVEKITQRCSVPKVPPLIWGLENESKAMKEYALLAKQHHRDFELKNTGLHINTKFPHLGATPDGLISYTGFTRFTGARLL